jgi:cytidylate kinase
MGIFVSQPVVQSVQHVQSESVQSTQSESVQFTQSNDAKLTKFDDSELVAQEKTQDNKHTKDTQNPQYILQSRYNPESINKIDDKMTVWFVLGPIGAGKTCLISRIVKEHNIKYLSADILKKETNLSYLEVRKLMGDIIGQHILDRISFVTEGTGQHDDIYDVFVKYKKNPMIDLKITFIDIPLNVALKRNKKRERVLDDSVVEDVYKNCMAKRERWKDFSCNYVDYKSLMVDKELLDFSVIY